MDQITKGANPDTAAVIELLFANDQVTISNDNEHLQVYTNQLTTSWETYGMQISVNKIEVMSQQNTRNP